MKYRETREKRLSSVSNWSWLYGNELWIRPSNSQARRNKVDPESLRAWDEFL